MRIKLLAAGLLSAFLPVASMSGPIYGEFTGMVWGTTESGAAVPGGIAAGAVVTGAFQFENIGQAAYVQASDDELRYLSSSPGSFLRISIGSLVWEAEGLSISVRNDSEIFADDMLQLVYNTAFNLFDPAFPANPLSFPGIPPGLSGSSFGLSIFDSLTTNLVSSLSLPGSAADINLAAANFANGSIFGNADGANAFYAINFNVTSVSVRDVPTAVPEASSLSLMAAGLLAMFLLAHRRTAVVRN